MRGRFAFSHPFVIAEAGVNHNGELPLALALVDAAAAAGCDAIKFQTWITDKVYSRGRSVKPDYQVSTETAAHSEYDLIRRLELSLDSFRTIKQRCERRGILFFSTPDEMESARYLVQLGVPFIKTASQDVTNLPFLRQIARLGIPVIYSTGACTLPELTAGAKVILSENAELSILHCVSAYPAPLEQMNLKMIPVLQSMFDVPVGLSDHTVGSEAAHAALALGSIIFEKHLTLDRSMSGPDHKASLEPAGMKAYVDSLHALWAAMGDGQKKIMPCEENVRFAFRRYIVAQRDLRAGEVLTEDDVCFKKVGGGLEPDKLTMLVGRRLTINLDADTPLAFEMFATEN
jgi:N,N'-diacetyllegionaminate synthase